MGRGQAGGGLEARRQATKHLAHWVQRAALARVQERGRWAQVDGAPMPASSRAQGSAVHPLLCQSCRSGSTCPGPAAHHPPSCVLILKSHQVMVKYHGDLSDREPHPRLCRTSSGAPPQACAAARPAPGRRRPTPRAGCRAARRPRCCKSTGGWVGGWVGGWWWWCVWGVCGVVGWWGGGVVECGWVGWVGWGVGWGGGGGHGACVWQTHAREALLDRLQAHLLSRPPCAHTCVYDCLCVTWPHVPQRTSSPTCRPNATSSPSAGRPGATAAAWSGRAHIYAR